jgi:hypothetical protein
MFKIDRDRVREILTRDPRPTSADAARELTEFYGRQVHAATIRMIASTHREEWGLPHGRTGRQPATGYAFLDHLGPIDPAHVRAWDYSMLTAWERMENGRLAPRSAWGKNATGYVTARTTMGRVTDYSATEGFALRLALPWELGSPHALRRPQNAVARARILLEEIRQGLTVATPQGVPVALGDEHAEAWYAFLADAEQVAP